MMKKNAEIEAATRRSRSKRDHRAHFQGRKRSVDAASAASRARTRRSDSEIHSRSAAYDEGLAPIRTARDSDQQSSALKGRGVERFNAPSVEDLDDAGKTPDCKQPKDDFKAAAETHQGSDDDQGPAGSDGRPKYSDTTRTSTRDAHAAESMRLYVSKGDGTQADAGLAAYKDYIAVETDPAKKAKPSSIWRRCCSTRAPLTKRYGVQGDSRDDADSPEANLGAGLAVYATGDKGQVPGSSELPTEVRGSRA
jgi:rubredoxin